ncbi:uncharacterized protein [Anoplolepis gracilipes]|uniref:uncharacterized protein n=1 Tax=Anoplolepis gracilipes TaxID=354296 RepID=UPI003BA11651
MKRIVLLVLALATIIIADKEERGIEAIASFYELDVQTTKGCMNEAGITSLREMMFDKETWKKIINNEDDEETKKSIETHGRFIACMLEIKDMMKDSKLVLNKLLEAFEKQNSIGKILRNKEAITECVNTSNENVELTRETRVFEFMRCINHQKM